MGYDIAKKDNALEKIAQIMSEKTGYVVCVSDIRQEICTTTTSIYSAVIQQKNENGLKEAFCILCTVRKWKKEHEYKVTSGKIA